MMGAGLIPDLAVVVCTYNRAARLERTLQSLLRLQVPTGLTWEVLVVDNNSSDPTRRVCDQMPPALPVRYLFEPRQGKSFALNRAIRETKAGLLLFTDDDVTVDPQWLATLWDAARRHPDTLCFGGRIFPRWEVTPPAWLERYAPTLLSGPTVTVDLGDWEQVYAKPFLGANLALRRSVFETLSFREDLGPNPGDAVRGEETDLQQRLHAAGHDGRYVPAAIVHHHNPAGRMTERYIREWFRGLGIGRARLGQFRRRAMVAGVPAELFWRVANYGARYLLTRRLGPAGVWVEAEVKLAQTLGMIQELRRQSRRAAETHSGTAR